MATNEILRICHRCRHATTVPIAKIDRWLAQEIICEKCKAEANVHPAPTAPIRAELTRNYIRAIDVWADLRQPPTEEMRAMFMPKLKSDRQQPRKRHFAGFIELGQRFIEIERLGSLFG
jgi:hypothetical protein